MKRIYIFKVLILASTFTVKAQKPVTGCPKIIFKSSQISDTACDKTIKRVGLSFFSDDITVKYLNKDKRTIPSDSVWGIRRKNEYPSRYFEGNYYNLYDLSPVCKYSRRIGKSSSYYFSTTLDAPIYSYGVKNLKRYADSAIYAMITNEDERNKREIAVSFYGLRAKLLENVLSGGALEIKYYLYPRLASGLFIGIASRKVENTYNFLIAKPSVTIAEIGWLNQYDLIQTKNVRVSSGILTGLFTSSLTDNSIKEKVHTSSGDRYRSKTIARNYQFLLEPNLDISVKIISNNHMPDWYISSKASYRFVFGNAAFGTSSGFSGYNLALGVSLIGFDR